MIKLTPDEEALFDAIEANEIEQVKALIAKGTNVNAKDSIGNIPLHIASLWGKFDIAKTLLEAKADVNAKNKMGSTPLHAASFGGHVDMAKALIEVGADVEARDDLGCTPLNYANIPKLKELLQSWRAND